MSSIRVTQRLLCMNMYDGGGNCNIFFITFPFGFNQIETGQIKGSFLLLCFFVLPSASFVPVMLRSITVKI